MKKAFIILCMLTLGPLPGAVAQTYEPTKPPGGIDPTTIVPKVYADGASGTLAQIGQMADGSIQQTEKGVAGGVPALNGSAQITAPSISGGDRLGEWQKTAGSIDRYSIGFESNLMGGMDGFVDGGVLGGRSKSLFLATDPYGPYSPGCGLGVAMMGVKNYTPQFPVSQYNPALGAEAVVGVGGYDVVANCTLVGNQAARLILPVDHYTANSVVLTRGLTAEEAAMIQWNMYITTNSPDTSIAASTANTGNLPGKNLYAGYIILPPKAGDVSISVWAWSVPGMGSYNSGQVPQIATLDTVWSAYTHPVVFLGGGAADHSFAHNWFFHINKDDLKPTTSTASLIHTVTPLEIDLSFYSPTGNGDAPPDHSLKYGGITFNAGEWPNALTNDSFEMMFGGIMHNHIIFDGGPDDWNIGGDNFYTAAGMHTGIQFNHNTQLAAEWDFPIYGDTARFMIWGENAGGTIPGYSQGNFHLGLSAYQGAPVEPVQNGDLFSTVGTKPVRLGDIQFGNEARVGSVSLCGSGVNCGIRVNSDGTTYVGTSAADNVTVNGNGKISLNGGSIGNTAVIENENTLQKATLSLKDASDTTGQTYGNLNMGDLNAKGSITSAGLTSTGDISIRNGHSLLFAADANATQPGPALSFVDQDSVLFSVPSLSRYVHLELGGITSHGDIATTGNLSTSGSLTVTNSKVQWFRTADQVSDYNNTGIYACNDDVLCVTSTYEQSTGFNGTKAWSVPGAIESRVGPYNNQKYSSLIGDGSGNWRVPSLTITASDGTKTVMGGGITEASYTLATLPTGTMDGQRLWCSDCKLNGLTGALTVWHSSASKWTDGLNNSLSN